MPFVLLHASYPYVRELGYLAAIYANVYADVGLAIPHLAAEIPTMLRQLLSLAPSTKVVYSSDASQIPELFWLAARWGRRGLGTVLDELIALGALEGGEALAVAGGHPRAEMRSASTAWRSSPPDSRAVAAASPLASRA